jgi:hypothetical protein
MTSPIRLRPALTAQRWVGAHHLLVDFGAPAGAARDHRFARLDHPRLTDQVILPEYVLNIDFHDSETESKLAGSQAAEGTYGKTFEGFAVTDSLPMSRRTGVFAAC